MLKLLINKNISKIVGCFLNSRCSSFIAKRIVKSKNIDMSKFLDINYNSYNEFFTRKYKSEYLKYDSNKEVFISPCDAKLMILQVDENHLFHIKQSKYRLDDIIKDDIINEFKNGYLLIFRLDVNDYHRYCFIDDGTRSDYHYINGILHTVQPIVYDEFKVFHQNCREWCVLNTKNFGKIIQVEVGALLVGKIINNQNKITFNKGDEKGFFEFGGSTILMFVKKGIVGFDSDIIKNSKDGNETVVKYGEKIGRRM